MDWLVYGALIAGFLAFAAAAAYLVVRVLQGWRALKRFRRHLARALEDLADKAEHTGKLVEHISDQGELQDTLSRLRVTLTKFNVLRAAADEVGESLTRLTSVYPRK